VKKVTLVRFAYTPIGTFGHLSVGAASWLTIERPWKGNERNVSCIPIGEYELIHTMFRRNTPDISDDYPAYQVMDVPGRTFIKLHVANTMLDVAGCIGTGMNLGYIKGLWAVTSSRIAYDQFMLAMNGDERARLVIENFEGGVL